MQILLMSVALVSTYVLASDCVFFQGFGEWNGLSPESYRRVSYAFGLYRAGFSRQLVCVGGDRPDQAVSGAALMRATLISLGMPADLVRTAPPSFDSTTNVEAVSILAKRENWESLVVVSSPLHLLRVRYIADRIPEHVHATFSAYDLDTTRPALGFAELWQQVHYEWVAWLLTATLSREQLQGLAHALRS